MMHALSPPAPPSPASRPIAHPRRSAQPGVSLPRSAAFFIACAVVCSAVLGLLSPAPAHAALDGMESDLGAKLGTLLQSGQAGGWAYALAFLAGFFTSLTPCVYPLIPITVSLFGAHKKEASRATALLLAASYVGGIAAMYSALGIVVGLTGAKFGTFMTSKVVMIPVIVFFVAMAASMFGAFELALPSDLQNRLSQVGGKGLLGAFLMGLVAGLIAAPCTGPPLAALLLFVGTQGSVVLGGSLLFVYALGMGVLFFVIAGFALTLPKSGPWMDAVKHIFGVVMLVAALYFLRNLVAPLRDYGKANLTFLGIHGALMAAGIVFGGLRLSFSDGARSATRKSLGILLMTLGLFGSVSWFLAPRDTGGGWLADETQALAQAKRDGKPLLVDFGASWCLPCKEMERQTFANPDVKAELSRFVLLRIDCSEGSPERDRLQKKYDSETLPSVLLFNARGERVAKLAEFTPPDKLLPILKQIQ